MTAVRTVYGASGQILENGILVAASRLETCSTGGQNESADRIHYGDDIPCAVYHCALERAEPEGRAQIRRAIADCVRHAAIWIFD